MTVPYLRMNLRNFKYLSLNYVPATRAAGNLDLVIPPLSNKIARFAFAPLEPPAAGQHIGWNHQRTAYT